MRVTLMFEFDKEEDGISGSSTSTRDDCLTLEEIAQFITDGIQGAGFSYVENTGFEKDDGSVVFGTF